MILFDLSNSEAHPAYQALAISNGDRQFSFLQSVVNAALEAQQLFLSQAVLKALNFHAIACLHTNAGEFRPCNVHVAYPDPADNYNAPEHFRVHALMDNFINWVNSNWKEADPVALAAYVLWRLCAIHPFINGNGRTARAAAYFTICVKAGGWLPGTENMITLLKRHANYNTALKHADQSLVTGKLDIAPLITVVGECLQQQLNSAAAPAS
ncbi:Fic family protein [Pararhodobacter zhoushanensis]|uniref:Fic family protein n=1 Tax=Pararhodobacter zhoushanensis TaxID=2479545 RepID=A0ABT3GW38_9RHOB|nr:Fic family protein [Pararhodobacter zhoushanensis]MCW1931738.1 Fic family protein [Pararhodobacter zhoushanensis]